MDELIEETFSDDFSSLQRSKAKIWDASSLASLLTDSDTKSADGDNDNELSFDNRSLNESKEIDDMLFSDSESTSSFWAIIFKPPK